jgi:hypothetical protein
MPADQQEGGGTTCPVCGSGRLTDISFDEGEDREQRPESREVLAFSCGHEVAGRRLEVADTDELDVEERQSDGTVDPGPA